MFSPRYFGPFSRLDCLALIIFRIIYKFKFALAAGWNLATRRTGLTRVTRRFLDLGGSMRRWIVGRFRKGMTWRRGMTRRTWRAVCNGRSMDVVGGNRRRRSNHRRDSRSYENENDREFVMNHVEYEVESIWRPAQK